MKPSRNEIAEALLDLISDCGGSILTAEAYIKLAEKMNLKESDFNDDRSGESWWKNEVRWTRAQLVSEGRLKTPSESGMGIWSLSEDNSNLDAGLLPTEESDQVFIEGSVRQVLVNKYVEEKDKLEESVFPVAPFDWDALERSLPSEWMAYSHFLQEHARGLSNSINEFRGYITSLIAWEKVLAGLDQTEKHGVVIEFVSPLATLALNMPYVIRSRFIYSVAHLSHQANQGKQEGWVDDLPADSKIYFRTADEHGKNWGKYKKLKVALEKIANNKYKKHTHDFRNRYNHRYSPRIEIGLTGLVNRNVDINKNVTYVIGGTEPLKLKDINPLLSAQHSLCMVAYEKYKALVNEQVAYINNCITSA